MKTDIDIDIKPGTDRTGFGVRGTIADTEAETVSVHPSATYLEPIPVDPVTGTATIDYKDADEHGFMKVDLLNNTVYENFHSKQEVVDAINTPTDWTDFLDVDIVQTLPHISKHYDLVQEVAPKSVQELADVIALIRPGKRHLLNSYLRNPESVRRNSLYKPTADSSHYFKKSHAVSYALMIVVRLSRNHTRGGISWS